MTGSNSFWFAKTGSEFYGHNLNYSIGTNGSEYMSRSESGNTKLWTLSFWIKPRGKSFFGEIWSSAGGGHVGGADIEYLSTTDGQLYLYQYSGGTLHNIKSQRIIRDNSSWTHVVVVKDTAQSTASNRIKFYVNGSLVTDFHTASYPSQDSTSGYLNSSLGQVLFQEAARWRYPMYGLFSEMHLCDGYAYAASDFGEFKNGIWIPIEPSVNYGTTGWHLDFADTTALGNDVSGNNNDWSTSNFAAKDRYLDNPTTNFAILNEDITQYQTTSFSDGMLTVTGSGSGGAATYRVGTATHACHTKTYFEVHIASKSGNGRNGSGLLSENTALDTYGSLSTAMTGVQVSQPHGVSEVRLEDATVQSSAEVANVGDIVQWAFDPATGKVWHGVNNTWSNSGDPANGNNPSTTVTTNEFMLPAYHLQASSDSLNFNFGQDGTFGGNESSQHNTDENDIGNFYYTPPSGFLALCSRNMPEPTIGPNSITQASDHFDAVLYTSNNIGAGGTQNVTGVGFQPDLVWVKNRTSSSSAHTLYDSTRGTGRHIESDSSNAEIGLNSQYGYLSAFNSNGFTITGGSTSANYLNQGTDNYVSWNWKANGGTTTTNDASATGVGTIDSVYQANTDAGFSIVTYTGTGSEGTIAHGLSSAPEVVMIKNRTDAREFVFGHLSNTFAGQMYLSTGGAYSANDGSFGSTAPTSTVVNVNSDQTTNESGDSMVMYCFHSVYGYSRMGAYEGNGNSVGPKVYTGFSPALVMIAYQGSGENFIVWDYKRDTYNKYDYGAYKKIFWDDAGAETDNTGNRIIDFLSNGFQHNASHVSTNTNGGNYIYMAFAEHPFKYSNGRT